MKDKMQMENHSWRGTAKNTSFTTFGVAKSKQLLLRSLLVAKNNV